MKKAAGTVLLFGIGLQMQEVVAGTKVGKTYTKTCEYGSARYTCTHREITQIDPADIGNKPCVKTVVVNGGGTANCTQVEGPKQCLPQFGSGVASKKKISKNNWCVWG